jgi:hypothetical protein
MFVFPPNFVFARPVARGARCRRLLAAGSPSPHEFSQPQPGKPFVYAGSRKNPPPFTLRLLNAFVNSKSRVSTGFLRFSLSFPGF